MSSPAERPGPEASMGRASIESRLFPDLLSLLLGLPIGAILLVVLYGPTAEAVDSAFGPWGPALAIGAMIFGAAGFRLALSVRRSATFAIILGLVTIGLVFAAAAAGSVLHRDFFTAAFQYPLCALIAVMYRFAARPRPSSITSGDLSAPRALSKVGIAVSVFYVVWVMLMGYAIATRAEPRPIESILYNVYNLAQVLVLFVVSLLVERNTFHAVTVERNEIGVDGRDIVPILGQKKAEILRGFVLSPDRRLRCSEIQGLFRDEAGVGAEERCVACTEETTKVALCAKYRNTYNSILELKRVLEFLEIGTITAPENKRRILADGWKLAIFENVRLIARRR